MPTSFARIVALLLVPCLLMDPALAAGRNTPLLFANTTYSGVVQTPDGFESQALNAMAVLVRRYLGNRKDDAQIKHVISPAPSIRILANSGWRKEVTAAIAISMTPFFYGASGDHPALRLVAWSIFGGAMAFIGWRVFKSIFWKTVEANMLKSLRAEQRKALDLSDYFYGLILLLQERQRAEVALRYSEQEILKAKERGEEAEERLRIKLKWKGNAEAGERAIEELKKIRDTFIDSLGPPPGQPPNILIEIRETVPNDGAFNLAEVYYLFTGQREPSGLLNEGELLTTARVLHLILRNYAEFPETIDHELGEHEVLRIRVRQILGIDPAAARGSGSPGNHSALESAMELLSPERREFYQKARESGALCPYNEETLAPIQDRPLLKDREGTPDESLVSVLPPNAEGDALRKKIDALVAELNTTEASKNGKVLFNRVVGEAYGYHVTWLSSDIVAGLTEGVRDRLAQEEARTLPLTLHVLGPHINVKNGRVSLLIADAEEAMFHFRKRVAEGKSVRPVVHLGVATVTKVLSPSERNEWIGVIRRWEREYLGAVTVQEARLVQHRNDFLRGGHAVAVYTPGPDHPSINALESRTAARRMLSAA